jgi:hypothetical protein
VPESRRSGCAVSSAKPHRRWLGIDLSHDPLLNRQFSAKAARHARLTFDLFNILGANADDTTYYNSWTRQDAANPAEFGPTTIPRAMFTRFSARAKQY